MKKLLYIFLLALSCISAKAQQDPQYSMYYFNGLVLNPAYAGSWDFGGITLMGRKQWTGMNGAPTTGTFAFNSPLGRLPHGVGLTVVEDKIGVTNTLNATASFAYRLKAGPGNLAFGIQLSGQSYRADFTNVPREEVTDPAFAGNLVNLFLPNAGAGVYYNTSNFYAGFSVPRLVDNKLSPSGITGSNSKQVRHYLATLGAVFKLNSSIKFKPSVLLKWTETGQYALDLNASMLFNDKFWAGVSYRHGDAVAGILQYEVSPQFRFGYAYDLTISSLRGVQGGSHELMLGWDFRGSGKGLSSPRYF